MIADSVTKKRVPSPATISSGCGCVESAMSTLCSPSSTSATPVKPAWTMVTAVTPLRAPMPDEVERLLDVVLVAHPAPQAGDLLRGVGQRHAHLLLRRASPYRRRRRRAPNVALVPSALRCVPRT